jgi:hypothetical protein
MMNVERFFFYFPAVLAGAAAVVFAALHVLAPQTGNLKKNIFSAVSALSALSFGFLYLYTGNSHFPACAGRSAVIFTIMALVITPLCLYGRQDKLFYFPAAGMFLAVILASAFGDPATGSILFCLTGAFFFVFSGSDIREKTGPSPEAAAQVFIFFFASFFMLEFYLTASGRGAGMAYTGLLSALVVSSPFTFYTFSKREPAPFSVKYAPSRFFLQSMTAGAQIVIISSLMKTPGWSPVYMTLFAGIILGFAMFKSITEESYMSYAVRDFANMIFLALLYFSCAGPDEKTAAIAACGILLSAAASYELIRANGPDITVTTLKLSPLKVKNSPAGLVAQLINLGVEIILIAGIKNGMSSIPAVQAMAIIAVVIYMPAVLNRIFAAASIALRLIRVDTRLKLSFNESALKLILYGGLTAALFYRW